MRDLFRSLILILGFSAFSAAQELELPSLKAAPPPSGAIEGVPAKPKTADAAQVKANMKKWGQKDPALIDKAAVSAAGEGLYEVDLDPRARDQMSIPDLVVLGSGEILLDYIDLFGKEMLLGPAKISKGNFKRTEDPEDTEGMLQFFQNGKKILTFNAAKQLAVEDFLQEKLLTMDQRQMLRAALKQWDFIPMADQAPSGKIAKKNSGFTFKIFDVKAKKIYPILIPVLDGVHPPTFQPVLAL